MRNKDSNIVNGMESMKEFYSFKISNQFNMVKVRVR